MALTDKKVLHLETLANTIRRDIIEMLLNAGSGHSAGPLGMADIFTALYFHIAHIDPKKPRDVKRDRIFLSNGHICPVWYATLAHAGFFPVKELSTLRKLGTRLQGHPHLGSLPGVENSGGPLGQGLSQAVGATLALRMNKNRARVFCLMSDGEQEEGQIFEAIMCAGKYQLGNLTAIMDRNNIQIDGPTERVMPLEPLADKYRAFNWNVIEIDGHNIRDIVDACGQAKAVQNKPTLILAHTIPGKGVDFMENDYEWHGKPPSKEEAREALKQLRTLGGKIESEHE